MTTRVYLAFARFLNEEVQRQDLATERIFVNASDVPEVWVETESTAIGDVGKTVSFSIGRPLDIGFTRVTGTIERKILK